MRLVSIPTNPVPEGAVTGMLKTPDGISIRYARWAPPPGCKGTVCVFPGRAEFIEKYFEAVRELHGRGFTVAMLDWRAQGLSSRPLRDPRKSHVTSMADYAIDLDAFMNEVVLPNCPRPLFGLGHSMGGAILLRTLGLGRRWFDRVVLSAPMIRLTNIGPQPLRRAQMRLLCTIGLGTSYLPGGGPTGPSSMAPSTMPFLDNPLTSDPIRHERTAAVVKAEPALRIGAPTVGWLDGAFRTMAEFADPTFPAKLHQPLLIVACGNDPIVSTPAILEFSRRLPAGSHRLVPGAKHEVLMEQDQYRTQFWTAFDAFIAGTSLC